MVADIEELETMDASEIYSKRLNAKEVLTLTHMNGEKFTVPFADGTVKLSEGMPGSENIHLYPGSSRPRRRRTSSRTIRLVFTNTFSRLFAR